MNLQRDVIIMLRHPDNPNLHLHYDSTFGGFPVMIEKGPFIWEYLPNLKHTIDLAMADYPRVLAFRVDLRPRDIDLPGYAYTNQVISKFFESFNTKIQHHRGRLREQSRYARSCKFVMSGPGKQGGETDLTTIY